MIKLFEKVIVENELGLHARPAAVIAKMLEKTESKVLFTHDSKTVDAKQIMNLLLLGVGKNAEIAIEVEGFDAQTILDQLVLAFKMKFGEFKC